MEKDIEKDPLIELSGTALKIYILLLRTKKPLGVREVQRLMGLKSPSTARHHLERLVELNLAKRGVNGYTAIIPRRSIFTTYIIIKGRILPRSLAIAVFSLTSLILYLLLPGRDIVASIILLVITSLLFYSAITDTFYIRRLASPQRSK